MNRNVSIIRSDLGYNIYDDGSDRVINPDPFDSIENAKVYAKNKGLKVVSIQESNSNIRGSTAVKIKKKDGKYWIYHVIDGDTERCISKSGHDSKEMAERSAFAKGFVMVDGKGTPVEYEFNKPSEGSKNRSNDLTVKEKKWQWVKEVYQTVLSESKKNLHEIDVSDAVISKKLDEVAELVRVYTALKAQVDDLMEKIGFKSAEKQYEKLLKDDPAIWSFLMEIKSTGEKIIQTKNNILEVKRHATEVETVSYQEAYLKALEKVNAATRKVLEDELAATKKISKRIGAYSSQPSESVVSEGPLDKFKSWINKVVAVLASKFKRNNAEIDKSLQGLEAIKNKIMR